MTVRAGIRGTGSYVPERVLTNQDLEKMVDTSDEWITTRTGIKERRIAAAGENPSDMAVKAAERALAAAGITAQDIDMVIVASVSGDYQFPSTACLVQNRLGCRQIAAFDLAAACSGFTYVLTVAAQFVRGGAAKNVLAIGVETLSRITDYTDRSSCILFGDGAGAVVVSDTFEQGEILSGSLHADGSGWDVIIVPAGMSARPASAETSAERLHFMRLRGREVYKFAVSRMVELVEEAKEKYSELKLGFVIPHQVNLRIIESARERLGLATEDVYVNITRYGNTSSASIPIALDEVRRGGQLDKHKGELIVMCAFGAGLTWGSVALKW